MKKLIPSLAILLFIFSSCENDEILEGIPVCIQVEIENTSREASSEATLTQYLYNGKTVYSFDPGVVYPDIMSTVIDKDCQVVCQFGGIAGMNTCPDFSENAQVIGVIWKNK